MQIHFILVKPAVPENVGAAARAIKTMGFNSLRLVNPCDHLDIKAKMLAHASNEILENASIYRSFKDSIKDLDLVIGTTAKKRRVNEDYIDAKDLVSFLQQKTSISKKIGIVFGCEESGLDNDELKLCHVATSIPMKTKYPSINLAQAVMLYAYNLSSLNLIDNKKSEVKNEAELNALVSKTKQVLGWLEIPEDIALYNRIIERINLANETDIHLMHSITSKIIERLND